MCSLLNHNNTKDYVVFLSIWYLKPGRVELRHFFSSQKCSSCTQKSLPVIGLRF